MSRFFVKPDSVDLQNNQITIVGEDVRHIGSVLRAVPGETLELSDGSGMDYSVVIESIGKETIQTRIIASNQNRTEPPIDITLFQGIPKADKMDTIIQKCIELGVNRIVPVITARTVVKFEHPRDAAAKTTRWKRIALEAAKQCDRGVIPMVEDPVKFDQALKMANNCDLKLLPYEEENDGSLNHQLKAIAAENKKPEIAVLIGPEGGFAAEEVERAVEKGFKSVTLGPRILRTETAGMAVVSIIMYELGDMGRKREKNQQNI